MQTLVHDMRVAIAEEKPVLAVGIVGEALRLCEVGEVVDEDEALAGMGIALPSVDYLAALALILASGAAAPTQVGALLMFNVVAFALVQIPLVAYLLAPDKTRASMGALNDWIRSRRRAEVATLLAVVGCVLLAVGLTNL